MAKKLPPARVSAPSLTRPSRLIRARSGAVAVMTALACVPAFGFAALAVDLGLVLAEKAQLQAATDAAALSAVLSPASASTTASTSLVTNNWSASTLQSVTTGIYCPAASIAIGSRYIVGGTTCPQTPSTVLLSGTNAVQVTTASTVPLYLARVVYSGTTLPIAAAATATRVDLAGFYAGTGLLSVDGGLENQILGQLLGTTVSLTAVQYNGLLNSDIDALSFLSALATNANISSGTYASLASSTLTVGQVLSAAVTVLNQSGGTNGSAAVSGLQSIIGSGAASQSVPISSLLGLEPYLNLPVGASPPLSLQAGMNAFDLLTFVSQIVGANKTITIPTSGTDLNLTILNVGSITGSFSIIQPPQFAFGPVGTSVHTAQVQLNLTITLLNSLLPNSILSSLASLSISLPISVTIASGTATLTGISCTTSPATMTVTGQPQVIQAAIGSAAAPATILSANLLQLLGSPISFQITGYSSVQSGGTAQSVTFTRTDTQQVPPVVKTVTSNSALASTLFSSLVTTLVPTLTVTSSVGLLGTLLTSLTNIKTVLGTVLTSTVAPVLDAAVDPLLASLLDTLGIRVGYIDIAGTGIRCGVPLLVQ